MIRKEGSRHSIDRMSLFLGIDPLTGERMSMPLAVLNSGHYHASGTTNSGKSQTILLNLIWQLIRGYRLDNGLWARKAPIVVLDLKGDEALFHATKRAAEDDGRTFRYLATQPRAGYYFFDPFQCFLMNHLTPIDLATDTIRSLGLDSGIVYAGKYFTDNNIVLLKNAIAEMLNRGGRPSLNRLSAILQRLASQPGNKDANHIKLCIDMLAEYPQLNDELHRDKPHPRIDFTESFLAGDVIYFSLPCNQGGSSLRQIAALALQTIVQAAQGLRSRGQSVGPIYVFVDEFYHIASKAFGDLLATARHWDVHFVLANQNISQLKAHDRDLPSIVRTMTDVKQFLSAEDPDDVRFLQEASGQVQRFRGSQSVGPLGVTQGLSEQVEWALEWNAIKAMNDTRNHSYLIVNDGIPWETGKRVRLVKTLWPLSELEYGAFKSTPLPSTPQHTLLDHSNSAPEQPEDAAPSPDDTRFKSLESLALQNRLAEMFAKLSELETG